MSNATPPRRSSPGFTLLLLAAIAFILISGRTLPARVGAHYNAAGMATHFMTRQTYLNFTLLFALVLPLALVYFPQVALSRAGARVNLPNREYWLSVPQRTATLEFVRRHCTRLGSMLLLFFCYVHWLVVRANWVQPPLLSSSWFIGGLVLMMVCALLWTATFVRHFQNVPI